MSRLFLSFALTALLASAASADSYDRLRADATVSNGLRWVSAAIQITESCPELSPRMLRGLGFLNSLRSHARGLGYDNATIKAYVDDPTEKARVDGEARAYLATQGVVPGNASSYCTVGKDHQSRRTQIGVLLR